MSLYTAIEKSFFNSLSKKIIGNVLFLLAPHVLLLGIGVVYGRRLQSELDSVELSAVGREVLNASLNEFWLVGIVTVSFALVAGIFTIFFMRHLFLRPINDVTSVLRAIKEKDGDISATLPAYTHDEISVMATSYNDFADNLKQIIADTRTRSVNVALAAARLKQVIGQAHKQAGDQESCAQSVFQSSNEAIQAIEDIARSTVQISEQNSANLKEVRGSSEELKQVKQQVDAIRDQLHQFQHTVHSLQENSRKVSQTLSMVQDFSDQTNLLALNASIEAARAGEAGRGFAVVADEVRNLAQKVGQATTDIDQSITAMSSLVSNTNDSAEDILGYVETTGQFIEQTTGQFAQMVSDFELVNGQLAGISAAIEELSYTNKEAHKHVQQITSISTSIKSEMDCSQEYSNALEVSTEESQELLSRFIIGYGAFEHLIQKGRGFKAEVDTLLAQLAGHCDVFDERYQRQNPGQEPAKFAVSYNDQFDAQLQPRFDAFLSANPEFIYAVLVDKNGYIGTHHRAVSQPLRGDFKVDNAQSRHRRIYFNTRSEQRRATHNQPFMLQTYIRDTGQILSELSIPAYINGRHWGALIMGFDPELLLKD